MFLNHEAIAKAYPNEKLVITDTESGTVVTDHSSKAFTINQSLVDAAQAEIDKLKYKIESESDYNDGWTKQYYKDKLSEAIEHCMEYKRI